MHENEISKKIIGCAIEVHKILGPGLLVSIYEEVLCHELSLNKIEYK
jgi:GxxExxY protein